MFPKRVRGVKGREFVCETPQVAAEEVVFGVVLCPLQVVSGADGVFAVVVFGFVGVEVYLPEESTSG